MWSVSTRFRLQIRMIPPCELSFGTPHHAEAELLHVEALPVDADLVADASSLFARGSPGFGHLFSSLPLDASA